MSRSRVWELWEEELFNGEHTKQEICDITGRSYWSVSSKLSKGLAVGLDYKVKVPVVVNRKMKCINLYSQGKKIEEIVKELNLEETFVRKSLGKLHYEVEKNYTKDEVKFILNSVEKGLAFEYIANVLRRDTEKVKRKYRDTIRELKNGSNKL